MKRSMNAMISVAIFAMAAVVTPGHAAWEALTPERPVSTITGLWCFAPDDVLAVTYNELLRWDGAEWQLMETGLDSSEYKCVWASSPNDIYVTRAYNSTLSHFDGSGWSDLTIPGLNTPRDMWGSGPDDIYVIDSTQIVH